MAVGDAREKRGVFFLFFFHFVCATRRGFLFLLLFSLSIFLDGGGGRLVRFLIWVKKKRLVEVERGRQTFFSSSFFSFRRRSRRPYAWLSSRGSGRQGPDGFEIAVVYAVAAKFARCSSIPAAGDDDVAIDSMAAPLVVVVVVVRLDPFGGGSSSDEARLPPPLLLLLLLPVPPLPPQLPQERVRAPPPLRRTRRRSR